LRIKGTGLCCYNVTKEKLYVRFSAQTPSENNETTRNTIGDF